jgi:hypothetical protein
MDFRLTDLVGIVGNGGWAAVPMILLFIIFTGFRGDWRSKREFEELGRDRDEWKALAKTSTSTAQSLQEQVSKLTEIVENLTSTISQRGRR